MKANTFRTRLGLLAEATNKELSDPLVLLWWEKYGKFPDDLLLAGFAFAIDTCRFFPSPAEFNAILDRLEVAQGTKLDGEAAWSAFAKRVLQPYSPGVTRSFDWPDELTKTIVRGQLGGVHEISLITFQDRLEKTRERFVRAYDSERIRQQVDRQLSGGNAPNMMGIGAGEE